MTQTDQKSNRNGSRHHRHDTYQAAGELVGLDKSSAHRVLNGQRETTDQKRRRLLAWAKTQAARGSDAPAVQAALKNLAA